MTAAPDYYASFNSRVAALIEQARGGDLLAFEELYSTTVRWLIAQVRMVVDNDQAEDILSDVYLEIWRSLASFDLQRSPATAWLRMIVRSRALDHLRRERARRTEPLTDAIESSMLVEAGPDHLAARSQECSLVRASLSVAPLTSQERMLLGLAYFHENTQQEMSTMTGLPLGTVKTLLGSARAKMLKHLAGGVPHRADELAARRSANS